MKTTPTMTRAVHVARLALADAVKANSTTEKLTDKAAREKVESMLGDCITETQNAPSLAREVTT